MMSMGDGLVERIGALDLLTPPGTPVSIEEREDQIRKNRAIRLEKHPGLSPQERQALLGWEQHKVKQERVDDLKNTIEAHRRVPEPGGRKASLSWKDDVSFSPPLFSAAFECSSTRTLTPGGCA